MRRTDREVTDRNEIISIIKKCDVCRLGLNDKDVPYILPLNFGVDEKDGNVILIFHSALEGKKVELLRNQKVVSFEMDRGHELQYIAEKGYCTMMFESVMGKGEVFFYEPKDVMNALQIMMDKYHPLSDEEKAKMANPHTYFNPAAIPRTLVYGVKVDMDSLTAKRKC